MKTIRHSVFETNSSSMHCVTLMTDEEYKDFDKNGSLFNFYINKPATWEDFYEEFKRIGKCYNMTEDECPSLEAFKHGVEEFNNYNYDPFDDENANGALWETCKSSGIFMKDGQAEIEESDREIDGKIYHAVSAYVAEG